jgi:hypothetical protein
MSLSRAACERRVYRLAALLAGDTVAAAQVLEAVDGAQPDVRRLSSAHLDRLTVLRSREIEPAVISHPAVEPQTARALAGLPGQAREAWVLARVYRLSLRETSRAVDCSTTATRRHLQRAEAALAQAAAGAAGQLLAYSGTLRVPDFYRARRRRRQQIRRLLVAVLLALIIAVILWAASRATGQSPRVFRIGP